MFHPRRRLRWRARGKNSAAAFPTSCPRESCNLQIMSTTLDPNRAASAPKRAPHARDCLSFLVSASAPVDAQLTERGEPAPPTMVVVMIAFNYIRSEQGARLVDMFRRREVRRAETSCSRAQAQISPAVSPSRVGPALQMLEQRSMGLNKRRQWEPTIMQPANCVLSLLCGVMTPANAGPI